MRAEALTVEEMAALIRIKAERDAYMGEALEYRAALELIARLNQAQGETPAVKVAREALATGGALLAGKVYEVLEAAREVAAVRDEYAETFNNRDANHKTLAAKWSAYSQAVDKLAKTVRCLEGRLALAEAREEVPA